MAPNSPSLLASLSLPAGSCEVMARLPEQEPEGYVTVRLEGQTQLVNHCTSAFRTCRLN